jgi:hypothetical protein
VQTGRSRTLSRPSSPCPRRQWQHQWPSHWIQLANTFFVLDLFKPGRLTCSEQAEVQFYYLDENSMIKGQVFRDNYTPLTGNTMDILDFSVPVDRTSRLSAFYPHVMSQNANGSMQWYHTVLPAPDVWQNFTVYDAAAGNHTGMAVLPADVRYVDSVGFVYVNDQGILSTYITIPNNTAVDGWAWSPGKSPPSNLISTLWDGADSAQVEQGSRCPSATRWERSRTRGRAI